MPEYVAPGVYVEETSFRSKSIEGVSTTTTGFVGPTRYGPTNGDPVLVTSLGEFAQTFGDGQPLEPDGKGKVTNYMWHAARAFFEESGKRVYIARIFTEKNGSKGFAFKTLPPDAATGTKMVKIQARYPGAAGGFNVQFSLEVGQNVVSFIDDPKATTANPKPKLRVFSPALQDRDVVWISKAPTSATGTPPPAKTDRLYIAVRDATTGTFTFKPGGYKGTKLEEGREVRIVRASVTVGLPGGRTSQFAGLALDPDHQTGGRRDSLLALFSPTTGDNSLPVTIQADPAGTLDGLDIVKAIFTDKDNKGVIAGFPANDDTGNIALPDRGNVLGSVSITLEKGDDGQLPDSATYEGSDGNGDTPMSGLKALESVEAISIVAAPGHTAKVFSEDLSKPDTIFAEAVTRLLISHAERMRYRIAVLDGPEGAKLPNIRKFRAKLDSTYAALYYPWVTILDPNTQVTIDLPPSGFVSGIYARNDSSFAVNKAPTNEPVRLALGFAETINQGRQKVLNSEGINCFRLFEGRGNLLWGARTISSDSEWKSVNLRRYFAYLEHSINRGSQFAVFMPNGEQLWDNVRRAISQFLLNEWQNGALLGDRPEKAFFVRCDRTTMTQNDLDDGRLVCLVGVAPLRPAEFVIFRIGQWTADSR